MITFHPSDQVADGKAVWIDLLSPTEEDVSKVSAQYGIALPSRLQLEEIEASSRLRTMGDTIVVSVPVTPRSTTGELLPAPLGFVLTPKLLVTLHYSELHAVKSAADGIRQKPTTTSAETFLVVIEAIVDYIADVLEELAAELNSVSRRVFAQHKSSDRHSAAASSRALKGALEEVGYVGDRLGHIRDTLLALQRLTPFVLDNGKTWIDDSLQARLRIVGQDLQSLADYEVHLTDKVQFLLDAILGFINTAQNEVFKVLTIVSVVGIPPTLIAGIYGMNFDTIHEYHWHYGYLWGLSLIVLSAALPTAWFKWRGWW